MSELFGQLLAEISGQITAGDLIQLFGVIAAIGVAVTTFVLDGRKQAKENGYTTYLQSSLAYVELEKLMLEYPALENIYRDTPNYRNKDERDKALHWYYSFFMIMEVVHHAKMKNWFDENGGEWIGWQETVKDLAGDDLFLDAWNGSKTHYSRKYRAFMTEQILQVLQKQLRDGVISQATFDAKKIRLEQPEIS